MTTLLLSLFAVECLAILGWGLIKRERTIEFPFLAAAVFFGWVLPQLVGLTNHPSLPQGGLAKAVVMAILCLGAAWYGYAKNARPARMFQWKFDRSRLLAGSAVLSLLGAYFFYQVSFLAADATAEFGGQWSGIITIWAFFSKLLTFGLVIALLLHLNKPSLPTLLIAVFDLMFYLERIIVKGRRAAMVELALVLLMALWFHRRWLPPRWAIVAAIMIGALVVNSIGDYRRVMLGEDRTTWSGAGVSEILSIDYVGNLKELARGNAEGNEVTNAVMNIAAADRLMSFDFGLSHWNWLVHRYVPAQWLGVDVKQSLMSSEGDISSGTANALREFGYVAFPGSTPTGLSDSFQSFWYFGAFNFFLIGVIMSRWFIAARQGNIVAQMVVMLLITYSLHAITHSTHWFFVYFVQLAAFLLPVLVLARVGRQQHLPYPQPTGI